MQTRKKASPKRKEKAVTAQILGGVGQKPFKVAARWREHFRRLTELRDVLAARRADSAQDALTEQPSYSSHMADAGTDTYDRDLALGMLSSEQDALYQIDQAIDRIHNGTYGVCELTGKPIEPARLEAVPWTRFSAAAERQIEDEGALKRTRLGPRETV